VSYVPDAGGLRRARVPFVVAVGSESAELYPELVEASEWLRTEADAKLVEVPGAHVGYYDRAQRMARAIRPILRSFG
jgi:hypothetical protein